MHRKRALIRLTSGLFAALLLSACIRVPVTDYQDERTNRMRETLRDGRADDTVSLLDADHMLLPDFHRFAIADNIPKRHASLRVVSKQPITIHLESVTLTDVGSNAVLTGDTSEIIKTRIPWAYHYYPYDAVDYRHYEDRVLVFRHTDERLDAFGSPEELRLDVTYRIEGDDEVLEEGFDLKLTHYTLWVTE